MDARSYYARRSVSELLDEWEDDLTEDGREALRQELDARRVKYGAPPPPTGNAASRGSDPPTDEELLARIQAGRASTSNRLTAWILLLLSVAVFAGAGALAWDVEFVALLVVALFLHESGHLIAMRLFRYKNLRMMFLPFLGAVASGQPDEQDAAKIAQISLAGPLFGMVTAVPAAIGGVLAGSDLLIEYAFLALFLNGFNLLPFLPLDGGHVLNELLFARHPKLQIAFRVAGALGLVALGVWSESLLLGALAVPILLGTPVAMKLSRIRERMRLDSSERPELSADLVGRMRRELVEAMPDLERRHEDLARMVASTWHSLDKQLASRWMTAALLSVHAFALLILAPGGMLLVALFQDPPV